MPTIGSNPFEGTEQIRNAIGTGSCATGKEPFIKLGTGTPPVIDYNIPQTTCFSTFGNIRKYINPEFFKDFTKEVPLNNFFDSVEKMTPEQTRQIFIRKAPEPVYRERVVGKVVPVGNEGRMTSQAAPFDTTTLTQHPNVATNQYIVEQMVMEPGLAAQGIRLRSEIQAEFAGRSLRPLTLPRFGGRAPEVKAVSRPPKADPYFVIIEEYRTCSYLGNYGAGRVVKTFSMLPGERSTITIRTYKDMETTREYSQNVIDSYSESSASEMSRLIGEERGSLDASSSTSGGGSSNGGSNYNEQYNSKNTSSGWNINGSLGLSLGSIFNMGIGGGYGKSKGGSSGSSSGGSSTWSEDYNYSHTGIRSSNVNTLSNALDRHISESNANRLIDVNTSTSSRARQEEEETIIRELINYNKSRVLNFIFRQLLQEYYTVTYLTNIRIAFCNGYPESLQVVDLNALENMLTDVIKAEHITEVRTELLKHYCSVLNFEDEMIPFIEEKTISLGDCLEGIDESETFWRVKKDIDDTCSIGSNTLHVKGVILNVGKQTLRTSSLVVDALLGEGEALDCFNRRAQDSEAVGQYIDNMLSIQKINLVEEVTLDSDQMNRSEVYHKVFANCCPPVTQVLPVAVAKD